MKQFISSNDGGVFVYAMLLLALIFSSVIYIALTPVVNTVTESTNDAVANGDISEQTASKYDWASRTFIYILPVFFIFIIAAWAYTQLNITEL